MRVVPYFGGKPRLAPTIVRLLPPHVCYVELFGGSAAVLLAKSRSTVEVLNDLNGDVVHFFSVLRDRTEELAKACALTPYARAEHALSFEATDDPIERARRFWVRAWQTVNGYRRTGRSSWKSQVLSASWSRHLDQARKSAEGLFEVADRLLEVQIEHGSYEVLLGRYDTPETLFYVDPPYLTATRAARYEYEHELTDDEHRLLLERLLALRGMVVLSGRRCDLYDAMLANWLRVDVSVVTMTGHARGECVWLNPRAAAASPQARLDFGGASCG